MISLAVLISNKGTGTNLQAIIDAIKRKDLDAKIITVISDTKEAKGLERAKKAKIKVDFSFNKEELIKVLNKYNPDYVVLAGWKQIITDEVIDSYKNRILNVHPGLIPDDVQGEVKNPDGTLAIWNKGKLAEKAIQNFLDEKATYAGSTVHLLTHEFDFGPVLKRAFEKINNTDTVESLYKRIKNREHKIYVDALKELSGATVLVIDGGGRGSALVKKYLDSTKVSRVLAVPGNDLMLVDNTKVVKTFPDVKTTDLNKIKKIVRDYNVNLVDVAQDDAVAAGVTDAMKKLKVKVFGPTKSAGQIEWDKAWSRNFMSDNNIPSPAFKVCKSEKEGIEFINKQKDSEWFIKASGLAAGKGAIYAKNNKEALDAISQMKQFGESGKVYLIEQCLHGEEFSSFAIVNKDQFIIVGHAQDHKRALDGDKGPNTGGMGCSSTPKVITPAVEKQIKTIFQKTVSGLVKADRPYVGILYLGGMLDDSGKVFIIEFNARWGDPEAQVIIPSINNDLYELEEQVLAGNINKVKLNLDKNYKVVITAASKGYPDDYSKAIGKKILGLDRVKGVSIFGAGVKVINGNSIASGGRLFYVMAEGKDVKEARTKAYNELSKIDVEGDNLHYRKDIGYRDLKRAK